MMRLGIQKTINVKKKKKKKKKLEMQVYQSEV